VPNWPDHVTGDEMVTAMDKVGVDGAIFISAFSMYRYDASYAVEVQQAHPGRFAIVTPVDPVDPAVADVIADWKKTPGAVGIRIMLTKEANRAPTDPGLDRIARAAVRHDLPVNVLFRDNVDAGTIRFAIDRRSASDMRRGCGPWSADRGKASGATGVAPRAFRAPGAFPCAPPATLGEGGAPPSIPSPV
jgi:predicted TIM-barrel fold metal-dependent hydrolase